MLSVGKYLPFFHNKLSTVDNIFQPDNEDDDVSLNLCGITFNYLKFWTFSYIKIGWDNYLVWSDDNNMEKSLLKKINKFRQGAGNWFSKWDLAKCRSY